MVDNLRSAFSDDPLSSEFSLRSSDSGAGAVCCFPALPKADFVGEGDIIALDSEAGFSCAGCCRLPFESITPPAAWTLVPLRGLPRRGYSSFQTTPPGTLFNLSFKVTCGEAGGEACRRHCCKRIKCRENPWTHLESGGGGASISSIFSTPPASLGFETLNQ